MGKFLTTGQIRELIDIDRANGGIRDELQELIVRLTAGGEDAKTDDPRVVQAKVLWNKGFGRELGFDLFQSYLATVPEIPDNLQLDDERFPLLVLVDGRVSISKACNFTDLAYLGHDWLFRPHAPDMAKSGIRWMRCQCGWKNRGMSVRTCRESFAKDEVGLDAIEGVALYAQYPEVVNGHHADLPNAVTIDFDGMVATLTGRCHAQELRCTCISDAFPGLGSASRRE